MERPSVACTAGVYGEAVPRAAVARAAAAGRTASVAGGASYEEVDQRVDYSSGYPELGEEARLVVGVQAPSGRPVTAAAGSVAAHALLDLGSAVKDERAGGDVGAPVEEGLGVSFSQGRLVPAHGATAAFPRKAACTYAQQQRRSLDKCVQQKASPFGSGAPAAAPPSVDDIDLEALLQD
ncbi:hypothetical protein cyc_04908 [Cyclospora cayetanensis]|uniref:Uncharacterized protein n=1 Tax=Cyclospora cayetanensis TaxID=88456 RepID=A0A1D3CZZ9_9EIME|nr:hypothetical protein cyc_04908 [Cyclospora cayetanensis]